MEHEASFSLCVGLCAPSGPGGSAIRARESLPQEGAEVQREKRAKEVLSNKQKQGVCHSVDSRAALTHGMKRPYTPPRLRTKIVRTECFMHTFLFHKRWARVQVRFGILPAILFCACALATCAQEVPKYRVEPFWPQELPNNWIIGQIGGLAVDRED